MLKDKSLAITFSSLWRSSAKTAHHKFSGRLVSRTAIVFGLLAFFALSLTGGSWLSSAQQQKRPPVSEAASLAEAQAGGMIEQRVPAFDGETSAATQRVNSPDEVCSWSSSTVYPVTILDQATVSQGGFLYTFGGVSTAIIANARKFDGTTWSDIAPLPAALEFPTAVSDGTFIYILGGALTGTGTPQTSVYKYDPVANTYMTLAPFTTGTWNQAVAYLGGKIYKFAGTGPATASTNVLEIYDVATNMWSARRTVPAGY